RPARTAHRMRTRLVMRSKAERLRGERGVRPLHPVHPLLAMLALLVASCQHAAPPPPPKPKVVVSHPLDREVEEWDEYTARLEAKDFVEIRARVSGYL